MHEQVQAWLFGPQNASVLSGWSFLLTVGGFAVTFWQLARTRLAASAARDAAEAAKSRASHFDAAFEVARLSSSLRESVRHVNDSGWGYAQDSLTEARVALGRLHDLHAEFEDSERAALNSMDGKISTIQQTISKSAVKNGEPVSKPRIIETLSGYHVSATRLSTRFEKSVK